MQSLKKRTAWNKGIKTGPNPEHSKRMKGNIPWNSGMKGSTNSGGFKKGHKGFHTPETREHLRKIMTGRKCPWLKDKKLSPEHKEKIRLAHLGSKNHFYGRKHKEESKLNIGKTRREGISSGIIKVIPPMAGEKHSTGTIEKLKRLNEGGKNHFFGKKHSVETRLRISKTKKESFKTPRGKNNPAYIDGKGSERKGERLRIHETIEYKLWREFVFTRDDYTCVFCGKKGGKLHADHIKRFRDYPELRLNTSNGRTLCKPCHLLTDTWGRKK